MKTTDKVLKQRGSVYGDFHDGVKLEADILDLITAHYAKHHKKAMSSVHAMYFSKIVMKLSRLAITPTHADSWTDIAGYARLVELHLNKGNENAKSTQE
jgi:hypothetical protein